MQQKKTKVLFYTINPVHYRIDLFKKLSKSVDLTIFFASDYGITNYSDPDFNAKVDYNMNLEGLNYYILPRLFGSKGGKVGIINKSIKKYIKKGNYDVVIVSGWGTLGHIKFIKAAQSLKLPVILRGEISEIHNFHKSLLEKVRILLINKLFKKISAFLSIGSLATSFYKNHQIDSDKIFFSPYTVDNDKFINAHKNIKSKKQKRLNELGLDDKNITLIFSGKLIPRKCPLDLLKAAVILKKDNIETNIIFLGDGPLHEEMDDFIKKHNLKNALITGFMNQDQMPFYYSLADVFTLPSQFDTFALVVNEAMCFKLPVITTSMVGASYDLIDHGKSGYIYEPGNIKQLAKYISLLHKDTKLLKQFSNASFDIITKWDFNATIKGFLNAIAFVQGKKNK